MKRAGAQTLGILPMHDPKLSILVQFAPFSRESAVIMLDDGTAFAGEYVRTLNFTFRRKEHALVTLDSI